MSGPIDQCVGVLGMGQADHAVVDPPKFDQHFRLKHRFEGLSVELLNTKLVIEGFNGAILPGGYPAR